jgi:8-oxo-dGTP diphosphatase
MNRWSQEDLREWYETLANHNAAAAIAFTDGQGRLLLAKPKYRDHWSLPGGIVEVGEPPHICAEREIKEEFSITRRAGRLLVIDWAPPAKLRPRVFINFIFDGGVLSDLSGISLQREELDAIKFFAPTEAETLIDPEVAHRVPAIVSALQSGQTIYIHAGQVHENH